MKNATFQFNLQVTVLREKNRFIAYSPALDLSTSGKTHLEAKSRFGEMISIFFEELVRNNTVEEVLQGLGWQKMQKKWRGPVVVSQESEIVRIPVTV